MSRLPLALTLLGAPTLAAAQPASPTAVPDPCASATSAMVLALELFEGQVAPAEASRIVTLAAHLAACPDVAFELQIHTDTVRSSRFNAVASQRVAEQLVSLLGQHGVAASRLAPCGYGESSPLARDPSWSERTPNTRLVLRRLPGAASGHRCPPIR